MTGSRNLPIRSWVAAVVLALLAGPALASSRVALVIGNAVYDHAPALANPLNDATDIGAALGRLGFAVTRLENTGYAALRRGLQAFRRDAAAARIAVVFYAGHGIEVSKRNFLVPVDARLRTDGDVEYEAVPLDLVMGAVQSASELRVVVLDACRDNPFLKSMKREEGSTRSIGRGLARVEPTGGGTLLAYSAKEGTVALDGKGRNSPYANALLRYLEEPGLEVGLMFRKVRDAVLESTGSQEPFAYGSLSARGAYFIPPADKGGESGEAATVTAGRSAVEIEYWKTINAIEDSGARIAALLDYKARFPAGVYSGLADIQLESLRERASSGGSRPAASGEAVEAGLGLTREDRRRIQRALSAGGFRPGRPDGLFGRRTRAAIAEWQAAQGAEPTGYLDADGVKALLATAAEPAPVVVVAEKPEAAPPAPAPAPLVVSDPSAVVLASGLRLSDWVMLAEDRLEAGEYRKLLVEGMGHIRAHGAHPKVETVVERAVEGLLAGVEVTDDAGARAALGTVRQIRGVAGERAVLAQVEAKSHAWLGRFPEAVQAYRSWLRLTPADHPERREMLAAMAKAERGERGPAVVERFRDCAGCPELVVVPAGSYMMGSPASEAGREDVEGPRHRVTIGEPFAVGVYEVTFGEWDACVSGGHCNRYRPSDKGWGRGRRPVVNVSWRDAKGYVEWLSRKTGQGYRLLSEAEWEYVARAGTQTAYHFGKNIASSQANYDQSGHGKTVSVGSYAANAFGLHDMHGNVWEWVEDCWNGGYRGAPTDGSAWESGDCGRRVARSGSWRDGPGDLRSAVRLRTWYGTGFRNNDVGFRIARTLTP